jgi:hypothetical protein
MPKLLKNFRTGHFPSVEKPNEVSGFSLVVLVVMAICGLPFFFCKYNTWMDTKSSAFAF